MKAIAALLLFCAFLYHREDYINLEAKGWVERVINPDSLDQLAIKHSKAKHLTLVLLPIKNQVIKTNGNAYLKCYLINNTDTTSSINRSDATISELNSEICINNKWVTFQTDRGSTCGRSYWIQKVNTQYSLDINFEWRTPGEVKLPFRLVYSHQGKHIYSNSIQIKIPKDFYSYVMSKSKL
jgi:hypothetical protein